MASKRCRNGKWEYVVKRAGVLEKPVYLTFDDEGEGDAYVARLEQLLDRGIVPTEHQPERRILTIDDLVRLFARDAHPSDKDVSALNTVVKARGRTHTSSINAGWVDDWITEMKRIDKLAPATIRAKVGAMARCTDWAVRKGHMLMPDHPFRSLPDGYAQYTELDAKLAGVTRVDVERDRRLEPGQDGEPDEHVRILATIAGGVLPRKLRPLQLEHQTALRLLYILALESAMRLREMYTLTLDQVRIDQRTIFLDRTKNGDKRQVPMTSVAKAEIEQYLRVRAIPPGRPAELLFPWWDGVSSRRSLHSTTDYLSSLWVSIFQASGCEDLGFHDLRHEATSRLFERTQLSESEIMKITGHKSHRMMMRYANLRGSTLAARLW